VNVEQLIESIEKEQKRSVVESHSAEGLARLQEVAADYSGEYQLVWSDELLEEIKKRPQTTLHKTKLGLLDDLIGGFKEQQLITVSASSKHGKTAWSLFLIEQLAELNPVMIPLEQSNEELVQQRSDNGYSVPRFLSPRKLASRVTVDWIEQRIIEGIAKYNTKLVVIDHLGYIDDFGTDGRYKRENLAYRIEMIMKGLKNIAKRWNVIILLNVHISQADEGKPPSLQDLKGSSSILQESDMVMMLWRKNSLIKKVRLYEDKTMVSVLANRRTGRNGNVGMVFDTKTGRYYEDNSWVESLVKSAEEERQAEEDFDSF